MLPVYGVKDLTGRDEATPANNSDEILDSLSSDVRDMVVTHPTNEAGVELRRPEMDRNGGEGHVRGVVYLTKLPDNITRFLKDGYWDEVVLFADCPGRASSVISASTSALAPRNVANTQAGRMHMTGCYESLPTIPVSSQKSCAYSVSTIGLKYVNWCKIDI